MCRLPSLYIWIAASKKLLGSAHLLWLWCVWQKHLRLAIICIHWRKHTDLACPFIIHTHIYSYILHCVTWIIVFIDYHSSPSNKAWISFFKDSNIYMYKLCRVFGCSSPDNNIEHPPLQYCDIIVEMVYNHW